MNKDFMGYSDEEIEKMQQADEDLNWMDGDQDDDDGFDLDQTPDYWECHSCGQTYGKRPMGGQCSCMGYVEEGYF